MHLPAKSLFGAVAAMSLVLGVLGQSARADLALEGGYTNPITFDGSNFNLTDGDTYDSVTYDSYPYTFDLDFTLDPSTAVTTPLDSDGDLDIQGTFNGTYTFYNGSTVVSSGTASVQGDFTYDAGFDDYYQPTFTNGLLTQTSGPGLGIYPGITSFDFSGQAGLDGGYFRGDVSPATVPLPASAGMGLTLLAGLVGYGYRRRLSPAN